MHWLFNTNVMVVMVNQPCARKIHKGSNTNLSLARIPTTCFTNILQGEQSSRNSLWNSQLIKIHINYHVATNSVGKTDQNWKCLKNRGNTRGEINFRVRWAQIWVSAQPSNNSVTSGKWCHSPSLTSSSVKHGQAFLSIGLLWAF